jgi:phospholipase C
MHKTLAAALAAGVASIASTAMPAHAPAAAIPIRHVVVLYQENHSFDNVLGTICAEIASGTIQGHAPCDGATTGRLPNGSTIPLAPASDQIPVVSHTVHSQLTAIDGGAMDGFGKIGGCNQTKQYRCYSEFDPSAIPNLAALAERFVVSDRTFELATTPSWAGHMVLASATLDGFEGDNPSNSAANMGWGCDSGLTAKWGSGANRQLVPSCVPDQQGRGPFEASPVPWVPTIFDRLAQAGLPWKIYGGVGGPGTGYGWTICPTFYDCLGSSQRASLVPAANVLADADAGTLPAFSIATPTLADSQHNTTSMLVGDNWIGQVVGAIMNGPDWSSTAIFIAYDDCGCFYDHVPPPQPTWGIRVPMVIVSPYARAGYTDSTDATYTSILAYTEHLFGLVPLGNADAGAYDYASAFDYAQPPLPPVGMVTSQISPEEQARLAADPPSDDDPT